MCALLLMYVDREDAFNIMCNIINKKPFSMKHYYTPGMPALKKTFYVLLRLEHKYMPKLFWHMIEEFYTPALYATNWFLTLFSSRMPIELTLRIWDIFFIEGFSVMYKIIIAIFKINQKELLKSDYEQLSLKVKGFLQETTQPFSQHKKPENDDENQKAIEKINSSIVEHLLNEASLSKKIDNILETANKLGIT